MKPLVLPQLHLAYRDVGGVTINTPDPELRPLINTVLLSLLRDLDYKTFHYY